MNSTFSTALRAHLAGPDQTKATGWRVTLTSGTVLGFTDLDRDIQIDGVTYLATAGYSRTDIESSSALNVDNGEITGFLRSPAITEDDLRAGIWDYAQIQVFVFNYEDLTMGRGIVRAGSLGRVSIGRDTFNAEVRGLAQRFAYTVGRLYTPGCRHILGDEKCGVDLDAGSPNWRVSGTLEDVSDDGITLYDSARAEAGPGSGYPIEGILGGTPGRIQIFAEIPDWRNGTPVSISGVTTVPVINTTTIIRNLEFAAGYTRFDLGIDVVGDHTGTPGVVIELGTDSGFFEFGTIEFTSGANAGLSMEVRDYVPGQWTIALPMPYTVAAGDDYILTAGCNKLISTCRDKFQNTVNFGGYPYLPGIDRLMQIGKQG